MEVMTIVSRGGQSGLSNMEDKAIHPHLLW